MKITPNQLTSYLFTLALLCVYLFIIIFGKKSAKLKTFREHLISDYKPPLAIALIAYLGHFLGTLNPLYLLNISVFINVFCMSSLGLTMAQSIKGFEPLPVSSCIAKKQKPVIKILQTVLFSAIIILLNLLISGFVFNACLSIFHETNQTAQTVHTLNTVLKNKWLSFFTFLSGAGICEEGLFRLFLLTLLWKITKRPWLALLMSSLCFGLYHLTPLDSIYQTFWQYPITQVISASVSGLIFGFFYIKRGFETSVLGHTCCDWLVVLFFM